MTYRNSEHYSDPTAGKAMSNVARQLHNLERKNRRKKKAKKLGGSGAGNHHESCRGLQKSPETGQALP